MRAYATSPLRLLTPRNHGHAAWVYASSLGGGLVGGDAVTIELTVDAGAAAFFSTQSATKVYRSPLGATTDVTARVAAGGLLIVAPDPVVCFADSDYRQQQRFDLADDASLVLVDWMSSGRRLSGERWAFRGYVTRTEVRVGERLLIHDAMSLRADEGQLAERMGQFDVLATVALVGRAMQAPAAAAVRAVMDLPLARRPSVIASASPLPAASDGEMGCLLRIAGPSVETIGGLIREWLSFVPGLLGDDPWERRW